MRIKLLINILIYSICWQIYMPPLPSEAILRQLLPLGADIFEDAFLEERCMGLEQFIKKYGLQQFLIFNFKNLFCKTRRECVMKTIFLLVVSICCNRTMTLYKSSYLHLPTELPNIRWLSNNAASRCSSRRPTIKILEFVDANHDYIPGKAACLVTSVAAASQ